MRWLTRLVLWMVMSTGLLPAARSLTLEQAQAVVSQAAAFPEQGPVQEITLPDYWGDSRPDFQGRVWYRLHFTHSAGDTRSHEPLAVYMAQACSQVQVRLNRRDLPATGRLDDPISDHCNAPFLVALPPDLLNDGDNLLDLNLAGYSRQSLHATAQTAGLSSVEVGPYDRLAHRRAWFDFWQIQLPQALCAMLTIMAIAMALLSQTDRRERPLIFLSGLMLCWTLESVPLWVSDLAMPHALLEVVLASIAPLMILCAVQFLLRMQGWQHPGLDTFLIVQCVLASASFWLVRDNRLFLLSSLWDTLFVVELVLSLGLYVWLRKEATPPSDSTLTAANSAQASFSVILMGLATLTVLIDLLLQLTHKPAWMSLATVGVPLALLGLGMQAIRGVALSRRIAEAEVLGLQTEMSERIAEVEREYSAMAERKLEQVTERERKRIAADLHDDLGAKLLTIVHTSESDRISSLAREALEEMRLSVRGLTGKPVHLLDALGDWRAEVVSRLSQANILAEWKSPAEEVSHTLQARAYVQTTRILREAVSNIIKHSGATHCIVACGMQGSDFHVSIQDNGHGIPMELDGRLDRGHGMASMKSRAKQMQGQCLVESGPGLGTVIRLTIPL
ncbi:MAG: sensor histidine kinase [Burkholderiaceae bacterium]|nr:sensor histidine kinase [Burkholderiaceae bacterium]